MEIGDRAAGLPVSSKIAEIKFVENHGVRCHDLFAFERAHLKRLRVFGERTDLLLNLV